MTPALLCLPDRMEQLQADVAGELAQFLAQAAALPSRESTLDLVADVIRTHGGTAVSVRSADPKPERLTKSYVTIPKTLGERVKDALQRRLFPKTNLTRQQLAGALDLSDSTVDNLLKGNHDPSGPVLDKLVAFFRDSFINEVWGCHNIHCIDTRLAQKAEAVRCLVEATERVRALG